MLTRERRSLVPLPILPRRPDLGRTGRKGATHTGLPPQAPLPPLTAALSRRAALFGAVTVAGVSAAALPAMAGVLRSEQICGGVPSFGETLADADRRLAIAADTLDSLQARADRHAAKAGPEPADPYTLAVAEMDLVAAGMAALPADTMTGMLLKVRAMTVPIVRDDDEAHGLALSVCRDLRRLKVEGALS